MRVLGTVIMAGVLLVAGWQVILHTPAIVWWVLLFLAAAIALTAINHKSDEF